MASTESRGSTGLGSPTADLNDGTSALAKSPRPGSAGMIGESIANAWSDALSAPDRLLRALDRIADAASLRQFVVAALGPQCFAAGVLAGAGADVIGSAVDLLKLVKTFVLADLHDLDSAKFSAWSFAGPLGATRLLVAKAAGAVLGEQMRTAAAERDALIKEVGEAIRDPGAFFGNLADSVAEGLKKDWAEFNAQMSEGTLEGRYRAGKIFGKLLIQVIALIGGAVAVAKTAAVVAGKLPKLAGLVKRLGPRASTLKPGQTTGGAAGAASEGAASSRSTGGGAKPAQKTEQPQRREPDPETQRKRAQAREERKLRRESAKGDKNATYELNKLKAAKGDKGALAENKIIDQRGDSVIKAGEDVSTSLKNTNIDVETRTEVIEVKSGRQLDDYADGKQIAKHAEYAQQVNKEHVIAYDQKVYAPDNPQLQAIREKYPNVKLEPSAF